ncbi:MAG: alginate export family protein [Syntrophotaleaceae bacterium]
MKQFKPVLAMFIALAVATPALAFNVEWHGDLNNRFSYSTQADTSVRVSKDSEKYIGFGGVDYSLAVLPSIDFNKNENDSDFFGEIKYRMHLVASDEEQKIKGVVGFEFGSAKFGENDEAPFGGDKNNFELRWAYTDLALPFDPASRLAVGLMPVGYNDFVWTDNAAGVKWYRKEGNLAYSLGWFRDDWGNPDDAGGDKKSQYDDAYAGDVTYVFENGSALNAFVIYLDQGQEDLVGLLGGAGPQNIQDQEMWLGLSGKGKWGNLSGMATAIYLTGEAKIADEDLDRKAYLLHAQGDYKMDKFTFTLGGLYASGDDDNADGDLENFDHIDISTSILGSVVIFDNYADDNSLSQAFYVTDKGYKIIYAGVKYALNDKTDVWGKYFWHNTAEDMEYVAGESEDEIGHEFVVGASYKIMKGVSADINAGYLVAGDALDQLSSGLDADDVFRTDARIQFKF